MRPDFSCLTITALRAARIPAIVAFGMVCMTGSQVARSASFSESASLHISRAEHTATLLPSGHVMVVGGRTNANPATLASVESYDPTTDQWRDLASLTVGREEHTATLLPSGKVLVAGGRSGNSLPVTVELYNPATDTWFAAAPLAAGRQMHTATLLPSGKVLLVGGGQGMAEIYDPLTNTWSAAGMLGTHRFVHSATLLNSGKVLVVGGLGGGAALKSAELYDPSTNTWAPAAPLSEARLIHTATLLRSGKVLVVGGNNSNGATPLATVELYDPANNSWSNAALLGTARTVHAAALLPSGRVIVAGGLRGSVLASAEVYDPVQDEWSEVGSLGRGRYAHTATALPSGKVLWVAGENSGALRSTETYDANTATSLVSVSPSATVVGESYTVSFDVTSSLGVPTGSVTVVDSNGASCGPANLSSGSGSCSLTSMTAGDQVLRVDYLPDSMHYEASSSSTVHSVGAADTTLLFASHTPHPSVPGVAIALIVDFAVSVPGHGTPSGEITVSDGIDSCLVPQGETTCALTLSSRGPRTLTATYAGDGNFNPSSTQVVHNVNRLPLVSSENYGAMEDAPLTVAVAQGVLANASDPDGDALTIANAGTIAASGIGGAVVLNADGSFAYTPPANANGAATFEYTVSDGLEEVTATAMITVEAVNDAPTIALATVPGWPAGETGAKVQPGFASVSAFGPPDEAGQQVQAWAIRTIADPANVASKVSIASDGTLSYTLSGHAGSATFGVTLQDNGGAANGGSDTSAEQSFTITVAADLDLSIAIDDDRDFAQGGGTVEYTIVVHNAGPNAAVGAQVRDLLPFNLLDASWTCTPDVGASCTPAGDGDINDTVTLPMGATLTYLLGATVLADPEVPIENSVSVSAPAGVPDANGTNNSATDNDAVGIFADGFGEVGATLH